MYNTNTVPIIVVYIYNISHPAPPRGVLRAAVGTAAHPPPASHVTAPQAAAPSLYAPTQYPASQQTQVQTNSPQPPVIFEEPELLEEPPLAEDPAPEAFPDDFPTLSF